MFDRFANDRPTAIGVVGPASVETKLRGASADTDADASLTRLTNVRDGVSKDVDCVVAATTAEHEPVDSDAVVSESDVTAWAIETARKADAPPVVFISPSGPRAIRALEANVAEYLPRTAVERAPATVLRRAVDVAADSGTAGYYEIYDNVSEPLTLHDPGTGELVHANRRLCELLGYDRSELVAMEVAEYTADIEGYDQATAMDVITSATETGVTGPVEWPVETNDGEQLWVEATLTPVEVGGRELLLSTATDVTDRRRQRRQLTEITEHIDEVVYLARADLSEVLFVNDAYAELFGQPTERVYEDPLAVLDAVHPEDREAYRADLETMSEHVRAGRTDPYEFSHRLRVDGETRWIEVTATQGRGPGGTVDRVVGVVRDVTDARRREREYEQVFHGVNDAIAVHDPETGEILDINDSYVELYGYDRETILRKGMGQLSVPEEGYTDERARRLVTSVAKTGSDETVEWQIRTADGERRTIESNLTVSTVGGHRRVLSLIRDITEQKRREREFEQIFHGVTDVIGVYDPETAELLDANETLCELLGYDRETLLAMEPAEATATALGFDAETIEDVVRDVAATGTPVRDIEWALRTASGDTLWLEVNATPTKINGERRVITIARDITARRDREERVQVLNRVLRHNLRNGVDAVRAYTTAVEDEVDCERASDHVRRIRETADELLSLSEKARTTERLLRDDSGQETRPIHTVVESVVADARSAHEKATFNVACEASDAPVEADILRLIVRELIENAVEHGGDAPSVAVRTADNDDKRIITVVDDGPGIPDHVLTPFRAGGETQLRHNHGLGLWLVNWGIRRLGGGITFERLADNGTAVQLCLP